MTLFLDFGSKTQNYNILSTVYYLCSLLLTIISNMNQKIKLAIVDYHNTSTFIKGLELLQKSYPLEIIRTHPSDCAKMFENNEVDVSLVPVGALNDIENYNIVTDYCIGCVGNVYSVAIFSNHELKDCKVLYLDCESRSSNALAKIICEEYLSLDITYIKEEAKLKTDERAAYVLIGDKVFSKESSFKYKYDLGSLWQKFTGLPFTFAVWIARPEIDPQFIKDLNKSFAEKVLDIEGVIDLQLSPNLSLKTYLSDYISFNLNAEKLKAMESFREMQNNMLVSC